MSRPVGYCRICGVWCELSEEHVPPQKAFNNGRYLVSSSDLAVFDPFEREEKGRIVQGGISAFTLCDSCNNNTGAWYGGAFVNWTRQGMKILRMSGGAPKLIYLHHIFALRVLKQIITMAFSLNGPKFRELNSELEKFVLHRDEKWLNPKYRTFVYFNINGIPRRVGDNMAVVRLEGDATARVVTEISHPPYGYVFTTDGSQPHEKLTAEITHFRRFDYSQRVTAPLYLPVLDTYMPMPLDYRDMGEILEDRARGEAARMRMAS